MHHHHASPLRCLVVWLAATTIALGLGRVLVADLLAGSHGADAAAALTWLCEAALVGCLLWAWAATSAVVGEALLGARHRSAPRLPGVPTAWRRWVLLACGAALAAGLTAPAQATPGAVHLDPDGRHHDRGLSLAGLPMPDRPLDGRRTPSLRPAPPAHAAPATAPAPVTPRDIPDDVVTVRAGDSLWSIAAADLGPGADDIETATRWRAVYAANRDVVGPDPDLVVPGLRLHLPHP